MCKYLHLYTHECEQFLCKKYKFENYFYYSHTDINALKENSKINLVSKILIK